MIQTIFCPTCNTLILDAPRCTHCGRWERPAAERARPGQVAWRHTLPGGLSSGITLGLGLALAVDSQGQLHALDAGNGQPAWPLPFDLGSWRIYQQVALADGLAIIGASDLESAAAADKALIAVDLATGVERWRRPLHTRQISDPLSVDGTILVATSNGFAVALAAAGGEIRWREPIAGAYRAAPAQAGSSIISGGDQGVLTALNLADGRQAWTFRAEPDLTWGTGFPF